MKKTVIINISGIIFNIDEDAYDQLQAYLNKLNKHFFRKEDKEIVDDIELRIAELFKLKITETNQVITIDDVSEVTSILGDPELFNEDSSEQQNEAKEEPYRRTFGKRFYRNSDDRILAGVASGLGSYFGIDPVIMRIIFVLLFVFALSGALIYILLWIVGPEARTPSQKLEMKGEEVNISNIEKSIKEEFNTIKKNFKNHNTSGLRTVTERFVSLLLSVLSFVIRFFLILIGVFLIILGVSLLIGFTGPFLINSWGVNDISLTEALGLAFDPSVSTIGIIGLVIVVIIPLVAMILAGIKLIFRIRFKSKIFNITTFIFWIMGLFLLFYVIISEGRKFQVGAKTSKTIVLKDSLNRVISIKINSEKRHKNLHFSDLDQYSVCIAEKDFRIYGKPSLTIMKSENDSIELTINCKSRGINRKESLVFAKNIDYNWSFNDSTLLLDDYFSLPFNEKWRVQKLHIILKIPNSKKYLLSKDIEDYMDIYNEETEENYDNFNLNKNICIKNDE